MKLSNKLKIVIVGVLLALSFGCSESFLDTHPTSTIDFEDYSKSKDKNPDLVDALLRGIYKTMIKKGTGGGSRSDFGQKGYDIYSDFLSSDMALTKNTFDVYNEFTDYQTTDDNTKPENSMPWSYYYKIIRATNALIANLGGNDVVPNTEKNKYGMGQAKAIRAYAYFYLTQFYINEYTPDNKVLPILTNPDQTIEPQSTTKEVYDLMIKDLSEAITLLKGFNRTSKSQINQDVAKALLAYVYGSMTTADANKKAKILTKEIIDSGNYTLMSKDEVVHGFNDVKTSGWMWGFDLTTNMNFGLRSSWWGQMDLYTYSYQFIGDKKAIDSDLYVKIPANDIRKTQFLDDPQSEDYLIPYKKFFDPERKIGGQKTITTDYVFMRVAEIYLLNAEFAAKTGDEAMAKNSLKAVVSKRVPDASYIDALSGKSLLDEIYLQTRIELFAEGKSYLAMKRFKATIKRGANHLTHVGETVKYNDDKLTWVIPTSEIQDNSFIK